MKSDAKLFQCFQVFDDLLHLIFLNESLITFHDPFLVPGNNILVRFIDGFNNVKIINVDFSFFSIRNNSFGFAIHPLEGDADQF